LSSPDSWLPDPNPPNPPSVRPFELFRALEIFDELVAWARTRETAAERAIALVTVVEQVVPFRRAPQAPGVGGPGH